MSKFIRINPLESGLKAGEKIIKAKDYSQIVKIEQLVRDIEKDKKKNDLACSQALLKAIQNGIDQGGEESRRQLNEQMINASAAATKKLHQAEGDLVNVVMSAVRKIIEDYDDEALALALVKSGLKLVCKSQRVVVRVNPARIDQLMQGLMGIDHDINFLEIMPDETLKGADCVLESDIGIVRASVEEQLQNIERSLNSVLK